VRETKDGVQFADPKVNVIQINSDVFDFWVFTNTFQPHTLHIMTNNQTLPFHVEQSKSGKWNVWVFQQQSEKVWSYIAKQTFMTYDDAYSWGLNYTYWPHSK
jgi:hypothetical protein